MTNLVDDGVKALLSGAIGAAAAYILFDEKGSVNLPLLSIPIPTAAAIGLAVAGGSITADLAHDYLLPHINKSAKLTQIESTLLQIGVTGAATSAIIIYGLGAPVENLPTTFLLGAGSAVAGDYIDVKLFKTTASSLF